ncbi:MAG: HD domain-containing phosphohydrolase [Sphingomonadales bacterium]
MAALKNDSPKGVDGPQGRESRAAIILAVAIVAAAVIAFVLLARLTAATMERERAAAHDQLGLVADSRIAVVDDWLVSQKAMVRTMADNATVRFFLTEFMWAGAVEEVTDGRARLQLVRNYLLFSAEQTGFTAPPGGADVPANVDRQARAGLAVLDRQGRRIAATPWTPRIDHLMDDFAAATQSGDVQLIGPFEGEAGELSLAVLAPVTAFEGGGVRDGGDARDNGAVGFVVGVRLLDDSFWSRLTQPGERYQTARNALVVREGDRIRALAGTGAPLRDADRLRAADPDRLAAAFAVFDPGAHAIRPDYSGAPVLVTGRASSETPWVLVRTVTEEEALGDARSRARSLMIIFALAVLSVLIGAGLLWRHGASRRVATLADRFERLAAFLRTVTDSQPTAIAALDRDGHYRFANRRAGADAGMDPAHMTGKSVVAVLGAAAGRRLEAANRRAMDADQPFSATYGISGEEGERIIKADHIPIRIPEGVAADAGGPGILMVLEDVTALVSERERREQTLRQLVTTLATIIDGRDPNAARHSRLVSEVAEAIAQEMQLDDVMVETAEIAGALMNIGKLMVAREMLTRGGGLTGDELRDIRGQLRRSADLLKGVAFDGPVVETIRQVQAHWDGSGEPPGLAGEDILVTARILAVANAFVGMISIRSYRDALPMDDVIRLLLDKVGTVFDRRPVAALVNLIENAGGRARWTPPPQE